MVRGRLAEHDIAAAQHHQIADAIGGKFEFAARPVRDRRTSVMPV